MRHCLILNVLNDRTGWEKMKKYWSGSQTMDIWLYFSMFKFVGFGWVTFLGNWIQVYLREERTCGGTQLLLFFSSDNIEEDKMSLRAPLASISISIFQTSTSRQWIIVKYFNFHILKDNEENTLETTCGVLTRRLNIRISPSNSAYISTKCEAAMLSSVDILCVPTRMRGRCGNARHCSHHQE